MEFDKAYIINLDLSTNRFEKISKRFDETGMPYTRFSAVLGYNVSIENAKTGQLFVGEGLKSNPDLIKTNEIYKIKCNSKNIDFTITGRKFNAGEIGVLCSHFLVWKDAVKNNLKTTLVFEDDFMPKKDNFVQKIDDALETTPSTYDLLYLHGRIVNNGTKIPLTEGSAISKLSVGSSCFMMSNAYAFNEKFAKYMLETHHFTQSIDGYLNSRKDLEVYIISDNLVDTTYKTPSVVSMMGCRPHHKGTCDNIHNADELDL